jgi:anti-sigma factor RsiW
MWTFGRHRHLSPELLSGYLDQHLSPRERERVSRLLAACSNCREELQIWRDTRTLLRELEDVPAPRSFTLAGPPPVPVAAPQPLPLRAPR